jgi:hypothetical protein
MLPISAKQFAEGDRRGSALTLPERAIGVRVPGAYMLNPPGLERVLARKDQAEWRMKENQENRARQERGLPPLPRRPLPPPPRTYQPAE